MILFDDCHLVSTKSVKELHDFAGHVGLPRRWFQNHRFPHYDVFGSRARAKVYLHRARSVTSRQLVKRAIRKEAANA